MKKRVAITGVGVVSSVGIGANAFWEGLTNGRSGVDVIRRYDASALPVRISAEVRGFALEDYVDTLPSYTAHDGCRAALDLRTQYALAAAEMCVRDAGLFGSPEWIDGSLYFGAGEGDNDIAMLSRLLMPYASAQPGCDTAGLLSNGRAQDFALRDQLMEPTAPASLIASRHGIGGEVTTCLTACAASAQAIGEALRRIQEGEAVLALTGGAHAMTAPLDVLGFSMLSALSARNDDPKRASRPFDRNRDGFVLGEGAGALVLEEWEHAWRRGAQIYGELIGYGSANDAYRVTDMHPEARGASRAIMLALDDAEIEPREVGYVNAHGTSTLENDRAETLALHKALGDAAPSVPVSSTKSMTGHAVAAAGAIELIASVLALRDQILPPTINFETRDPDCDLDYVPNQARAKRFDVAVSNSFGFGGQNVTLVVRSAEAHS
ncbi:MAG TPA: beta-ketoacyl synthase N-terminal-like domain-containing protein [Gemmatimonadaceae bacterium]|nr:beta-ketoacyl synthase N-terminal-like domain-containing protein [Gemmatimonadaceae bacterium]